MAQAQQEKPKREKASETEAPTPGESPELQAGGSSKALLTKMAPHAILACIHALHLQTMHEMGSVREVDQTLARTLMVNGPVTHKHVRPF